MEHPINLMGALAVVEWYGAVRHLGYLRDNGEQITDTLMDIVGGECDRRCRQWWFYRTGTTPNLLDFAVVEADARKYLTENVDDLNALLAERI